MHYTKPNILYYRVAQVASWFVARFIFHRKILRNEIKGKKGPFVVIANHQAALDFVNLIGLRSRPMSFVISNSFYNSLPLKRFMDKMGVIPKQQFQTTLTDMKRLKSVIKHGEALVIYPAGLMCEDGLSTPIPHATYKFLKWLDADVYVAKTSGTYFVMPKWAKGLRPGHTYMDVYKLFSKEELAALDVEEVKKKTDDALLFDAYREQDTRRVKYHGNQSVEGLEHVLYLCPHCGSEFTIHTVGQNTLSCSACSFAHHADEYALLHNCGETEEGFRYISDWSKWIYRRVKEQLRRCPDTQLSCTTSFYTIDPASHKFSQAGRGSITLCRTHFLLEGELHGEPICLSIPTENIPALPFCPGNYLEIQHGSDIYRCTLDDGKLVMKFINMIKVFYELSSSVTDPVQ